MAQQLSTAPTEDLSCRELETDQVRLQSLLLCERLLKTIAALMNEIEVESQDTAQIRKWYHQLETVHSKLPVPNTSFKEEAAKKDHRLHQVTWNEDKAQDLNNHLLDLKDRLSRRPRYEESLALVVNSEDCDVDTRLNRLESQVKEILASNEHFRKQQSAEVQKMVSTVHSEIQDNIKDLEKRFTLLLAQTKEVSSPQTDKIDQLDNMLAAVTSKISSAEKSIDYLLFHQDSRETKILSLTDSVQVADESRKKAHENLTKKVEDLDLMHRQLCQMMARRVQPLRQLQNILNKHRLVRAQTWLEFSPQLENLTSKLEDLSRKVVKIECTPQNPAVGFTAYMSVVTKMATCFVIRDFNEVLSNQGNCYNRSTGMFTAPRDGLYVTSVSLRQRKEGKVDVHVIYAQPRVPGLLRVVCKCSTHSDKKSACAVAVTPMTTGDVLFTRAVSVIPDAALSQYSSFSCFLIG